MVVLGAGAIGIAIAGLMQIKHAPLDEVRSRTAGTLDYADALLIQVDTLITDARAILPALDAVQRVMDIDVNATGVAANLKVLHACIVS